MLIIGAIFMNTIPVCFLWKPRKAPHTNSIAANNITNVENIPKVLVEDNENKITHLDIVSSDEDIHSINTAETTSGMDNLNKVPQHPDRTGIVVVRGRTKTPTSKDVQKGRMFLQDIHQIVTNKVFMLFVGGIIITNPSLVLIILFMVDIYRDNGLTTDDASLGLVLLNVMGMCGRLIPGLLMKSKYVHSTLFIPTFTALLAALVIFILTLVRTKWMIIICSSLTGIPLGMTVTTFTVMVLHMVGEQNMPTGTGLVFTANAIGSAIIGPVSGEYFCIFF